MWICDYISDIGFTQNRIKPSIKGIDLIENKSIPISEILLKASNIISIDDYQEVGDKEAVCRTSLIRVYRKILIQDGNSLLEMVYPRPFTDLDWQAIDQLEYKVETKGELLSDYLLKKAS